MEKIKQELQELKVMASGYQRSKILFAATRLKVFDHLKNGKTAKVLSKKLETDPRATEILLDALSAMGLISKEDSRYYNNEMSNRYLVTRSPYYHGDILRHHDTLWKNWTELDTVIKTGSPNRAHHDHDAFIMGMDNVASLKVSDVISSVDLTGVKTALDLGGGPGTYSVELSRRGIEVTLFDRPETLTVAREIIDRSGERNIHYLEGDFMVNGIGKGYDLVLVSQVLHSLSIVDIKELLKKIKRSLNKKGTVVIHEFLINNDMVTPLHSALFSVNMLINTPLGRCYTFEEMSDWLSKTGFINTTSKMVDDTILVMSSKQ